MLVEIRAEVKGFLKKIIDDCDRLLDLPETKRFNLWQEVEVANHIDQVTPEYLDWLIQDSWGNLDEASKDVKEAVLAARDSVLNLFDGGRNIPTEMIDEQLSYFADGYQQGLEAARNNANLLQPALAGNAEVL